MEIVLVVVLVVLFVGGAVAMKKAGWLEGGDDTEIERARGSVGDQSAGPYSGM